MFEELLRTDPSSHVFGLRLNFWVVARLLPRQRVVLRLLAVPAGPGAAASAYRRLPPREGRADEEAGTEDGRAEGPRPVGRLRSLPVIVRELELDLDAFEGPFDLLLTLVLKDELELREIDVAGIVLAFLERLSEREELDLEACGEFLVLIAALLELKARGLFPEEAAELAELEPEAAAEELARRLAEYRRMKEAAGWLRERLETEGERYFRLGPAPLAPKLETPLAPQQPERLAQVLRLLATEPRAGLALAHGAPVPARLAVSRPLPRGAAAAVALRLRRRGARPLACRAGGRVPRAARPSPLRRDRDRPSCPLRADSCGARRGGNRRPRRKDRFMDRPLRLIAGNPLDQLARTIEALLVIASTPLSVQDLADAADDHVERVETALGLVGERYQEGRSGIVLENVAGGWAFRASRDAAESCARLFEKPAQRNLSQASLETLAIVAYLGPCSRPDIARIRGVSADSAVANLVERGLIAEAGPRRRRGGDPLQDDAALRARVRPREPLAAAAPRRHRRRHGADPRAAARGRRAAHRLALPSPTRSRALSCAFVHGVRHFPALRCQTPFGRKVSDTRRRSVSALFVSRAVRSVRISGVRHLCSSNCRDFVT